MKGKSTISYILRNFLFIGLPASVAAVTLALFNKGKDGFSFFIDFLRDLNTFSYLNKTFYEIFSYFSPIDFSNFWLSMLCIVAILISFCVIICSVERHMRLGVRSAARWLVMLNDSFLLVLPYVGILIAMLELFAVVATSVIVLLGLGMHGAWLFVISITIVILLYLLFLFLFVLLVCTVPSMVADGYSFRFAASYSANIVQQRLLRIIINLTSMIAISITAKWAFKFWLGDFSLPIDIVFYMFWVMYVPVFAMKSYITLTGGERKDIKPKYSE